MTRIATQAEVEAVVPKDLLPVTPKAPMPAVELEAIRADAQEYQQRAEGGGWPLPNENGIEHGELIMVVRKRNWEALLAEVDRLCLAFDLLREVADLDRTFDGACGLCGGDLLPGEGAGHEPTCLKVRAQALLNRPQSAQQGPQAPALGSGVRGGVERAREALRQAAKQRFSIRMPRGVLREILWAQWSLEEQTPQQTLVVIDRAIAVAKEAGVWEEAINAPPGVRLTPLARALVEAREAVG